ncbi:uncharacterized protein T551_00897 [Pneumocystis jirovecii RU7]|uniref:Guided entry of tail-anchored proteins 1 n=1 Tax=Pneumocystis jirovecii (strain RU7) TaxID=1408657 RepID=A0A0W4ZV11_PNEJ7|nr:uncharacterized protein T551_00897 [Pneumocystis jirovecii RU7]KTW32215.1 hypothetical protein T551_00897 [Pneumocystis jirovecii RU7]
MSNFISALGTKVISSLIYTIFFSFIPSTLSSVIKKHRLLQRSALETKKELSNTSSVDEFAKWAKLKRKYDKEVSEIEKISAEINSQQYNFNIKVHTMIWLCTTGLKYIIQWYYRKVPVFWLIKGWFPYYIERIMCFPMAPIGSVSISIWFLIVNQIVSKVFLSSIKYIKKEHIRRIVKSSLFFA